MGAAIYNPSQSNRTLVSEVIVCAVFIPLCSITAECGGGVGGGFFLARGRFCEIVHIHFSSRLRFFVFFFFFCFK